ncbi:hypothetical protein [Yersinia phage fHe-Yen9-03]|uniref:Uncharacterized protein n=1 Tax=Yersinia phage fHe-Yen9-03 TaxID=2052743 RepID=A0A2C9D1Q6_9CAUD|nr:hypothetical protein [Yersinia phage fHe-Yen9-03]
MSLTSLVLLMFVTACITLIANKLIAANIYKKTVFDIQGQKSPYGISIEQGKSKWGYCITKNGKVQFSMNGSAPVYHTLEDVLKAINILEKLEGYILTTISVEQE